MDLIQRFPNTNSYTIQGNGQAVLMIHGLTSTPAFFHPLARRLSNKLGWEIRVPLLPGHGLTPEKLDEVSHSDWISFCEKEMSGLISRFAGVHLVGTSMGGTLCAYLTMKHPSHVRSLTLLAPALDLRHSWSRRLLTLIRLLPACMQKKIVLQKPDSPITDPVSYLRYSAKAVVEMDRICRLVRREFRTSIPVLIFSPTHDQTIHPRSSSWFFDRAQGEIKKIIHLENSPHVVFLGSENENIYGEIEDFLRRSF